MGKFVKAKSEQAFLKLALYGKPGSGKTLNAGAPKSTRDAVAHLAEGRRVYCHGPARRDGAT